jgi:hypothetical protein
LALPKNTFNLRCTLRVSQTDHRVQVNLHTILLSQDLFQLLPVLISVDQLVYESPNSVLFTSIDSTQPFYQPLLRSLQPQQCGHYGRGREGLFLSDLVDLLLNRQELCPVSVQRVGLFSLPVVSQLEALDKVDGDFKQLDCAHDGLERFGLIIKTRSTEITMPCR